MDFKVLQDNDRNNLISLLKPVGNENGLKLAICICMYSEDKEMLNKTLKGVAKNVASFYENGIHPHEIGVFVIMDGIEVVHPSVVEYFELLEKSNNIFF